ncbi:GIY-YIG nuclease family protein [Paenibacillus sp. y28]|uniref:GIY-YIG nuclease family protein n=1 Tax=Paenibacillus sp. y28 TaxID=3129110 RepID=UPI00301A7E45
MDKNKRKELLEEYKQIKTYMGIIQITNKTNGKIYIDSYPNLKNKWLAIQSQLDIGRFVNARLQKDWKELGSEAFSYEVLEQKKADEVADRRWELKQMKKSWLEKLQPYGDRGYNKPSGNETT